MNSGLLGYNDYKQLGRTESGTQLNVSSKSSKKLEIRILRSMDVQRVIRFTTADPKTCLNEGILSRLSVPLNGSLSEM